MRKNPTKTIERFRVRNGPFASNESYGANGKFLIPKVDGVILSVVVSDGSDWEECGFPGPVWEHVSVSLLARCPTWEEMDLVKRIFWRDNETVLQFHVPRSEHLNYHEFCLHLWKPVGFEIPLPPKQTVAPVL
jgi:hypothetical protein